MLVVVENRYIHHLLELSLYLEAVGTLDVFKVNASEGRPQSLNDVDELFGVLAVNAKIDGLNSSKFVKQYGFSFHNRF